MTRSVPAFKSHEIVAEMSDLEANTNSKTSKHVCFDPH